ncbi:MAG: S41 family peptidase, partial [Pisciglobus halotolerans]|nr:S41 family peptidase [Pisciglobus halotolerans]
MKDNPENKPKKKVTLPLYLLSLIVVAVLSISGTALVTLGKQSDPKSERNVESSLDDSEKTSETLSKVEDVYNTILAKYYTKVDSDKLIEGALNGMTQSLEDPYTDYMDASETGDLDESINASFEGIGAEVMKQGDLIQIVSPIAGSPAEKVGLLPNDIILKVEDTELAGMSLSEAVSHIRGERGTEITLTIKREGPPFEVEVTRDTIPIETVVYNIDEKDKSIGYIAITNFSVPTYDEVVAAVKNLRKQGAESFIFDVRSNPGGLLETALTISNMFLEDGDTIVQTEERGEKPVPTLADDQSFGEFKVTEPSVLLVNEGSASASEIVAGAMSESAGIPLVGTKTFGKGTVQSVLNFEDESELKLTIGKWLTPSGKWIHKKGIIPDKKVSLPSYANLMVLNPSETYKEGDVSEEVKNLEELLQALKYNVKADGSFDKETKEAVKEFQTDQDLKADGIATGETSSMLVNKLREKIEENDTQ